jgi:hypothetical protein
MASPADSAHTENQECCKASSIASRRRERKPTAAIKRTYSSKVGRRSTMVNGAGMGRPPVSHSVRCPRAGWMPPQWLDRGCHGTHPSLVCTLTTTLENRAIHRCRRHCLASKIRSTASTGVCGLAGSVMVRCLLLSAAVSIAAQTIV